MSRASVLGCYVWTTRGRPHTFSSMTETEDTDTAASEVSVHFAVITRLFQATGASFTMNFSIVMFPCSERIPMYCTHHFFID